jgi:PAP2 superfamily protein
VSIARFSALAVVVLLLSGTAQAQPPELEEDEHEERWLWQRFHPAEYVIAPALLGGAFALRFGAKWSTTPNITGGVWIDDGLYEDLYPESETARTAWDIAGDIPFFASFAWSVADPIFAGIAYDWDVAWQMTLINVEAYAVYASILYGTQYFVRQRRPTDRPCDGAPGPGRSDRCDDPNSVRAFIGGHTGMVATTAALTCMHHSFMPLYGGGANDALPCASWIAGTALVFTSRTVTGSHYLSDNLIGLAAGAFAGGFVPWALHYAWGATPTETRADHSDVVVLPNVGPTEDGDGATLGLNGVW